MLVSKNEQVLISPDQCEGITLASKERFTRKLEKPIGTTHDFSKMAHIKHAKAYKEHK